MDTVIDIFQAISFCLIGNQFFCFFLFHSLSIVSYSYFHNIFFAME